MMIMKKSHLLIFAMVLVVLISGCSETFVSGGGGGLPELPSTHTKIGTADTAKYKRGDDLIRTYTTEIRYSDDSYAVVDHTSSYVDYLEVEFPSLGVPANAQINNVVFQVEAKGSRWEKSPGMEDESNPKDDFYVKISDTNYYIGDWDASNSQDAVWLSKNAANTINTAAKANSIKIRLFANPSGTGTYTYFDTVRVVAEYTIG